MESLKGGRYVITRALGEGTQGATHEAVDKREGRLVAIKRYVVRDAKEWKAVELAEREATVLAQLSHPLLPAYVEHFEEDGALYLVMERIPGVSIAEFVKRGAVFDEDDVKRFLEQASVALAYLHGRTPPVIHRDIKPRNVVRKPDGSFALVDFGSVAHRLKQQGGSTIVGTYGYMAPEQFQGRASAASDVYAVGATAVFMLTNLEPEDLPHRGLAVDVAAALGPRASPTLVTILSAMLEPDPDKRPKSIAPLLGGFEVRGKVRVAPSSRPPAAKKKSSRPPPNEREEEEPQPDAVADALRLLRKYVALIWILVGFAWWLMPQAIAMGVTIGTVILTVAANRFHRRERPRLKRFGKQVAVRYVLPDPDEREEERREEEEEDVEERRRHRR